MPAGVKGASVALGMAEVSKHGNMSLLPSASLTVHPRSSGHSQDPVAIWGWGGVGGQRRLASYSCFNLKKIPNTIPLEWFVTVWLWVTSYLLIVCAVDRRWFQVSVDNRYVRFAHFLSKKKKKIVEERHPELDLNSWGPSSQEKWRTVRMFHDESNWVFRLPWGLRW